MKNKPIIRILFLILLPIYSFAQENCYKTFYEQGIREFEADDFDSAIKSFKAAKFCPDKPSDNDVNKKIQDAQNGYIIAIEKARNEALQLKKEAVALRSFVKGQEREFKGFYLEAMDYYSAAVDSLPKDTLFRERRAQLAMSVAIAQYDLAKEDLNFLITNGSLGKQADYYNDLAYVREKLGDLEGAIAAQTVAYDEADVQQKGVYRDRLSKLGKPDEISRIIDTTIVTLPPPTPTTSRSIIKVKNQKGQQACIFEKITIKIGDKSFSINENQLIIEETDLLPGTYQYEITGDIQCSEYTWEVIGKGTISFRSDTIYYLYWEKNKYGKCEMWLSNY